jgi:hypothetical protein
VVVLSVALQAAADDDDDVPPLEANFEAVSNA